MRRAYRDGIVQGWDLHPAQLPARYGALFATLREEIPPAAARLRQFLDQAAQATRLGAEFDDAATARGPPQRAAAGGRVRRGDHAEIEAALGHSARARPRTPGRLRASSSILATADAQRARFRHSAMSRSASMTSAVQPVWWLAPRPRPVSPWKNS